MSPHLLLQLAVNVCYVSIILKVVKLLKPILQNILVVARFLPQLLSEGGLPQLINKLLIFEAFKLAKSLDEPHQLYRLHVLEAILNENIHVPQKVLVLQIGLALGNQGNKVHSPPVATDSAAHLHQVI